MPHSPAVMSASALFCRPPQVNQPSLAPRASRSIIFTPKGPLILSVVARPSNPFRLSANG
jgi:hypothetical protein